MDRELPQKVKHAQFIKRYAVLSTIVIALVLSLFGLKALISPSVKKSDLFTAVAEQGSIEDALTASGVVVPEFEQVMISPIQSKVEKVYLQAGDIVRKGQPVINLNKEPLQLQYDRINDELDMKKSRKIKMELNLERVMLDLQGQYDIKLLRIRFNQSQLEMERELRDLGVGTKEAYELAELSLAISEKELEQLQKQMENQRKSLEADITEHDLEIRITERNLQELRRQLRLAEAKSESDGVVTWVADRIGSAVNVGDPLARIADLNSFKIEGSISDMHSDKLKLDGPIKVRVSGIDLYGKIVNIDPSMENGIARFIVELEQNNHANLRPNLRVDVFVITNTKENVVRVENGPFVNGSGIQDIFVIDDDKAIRKTVTIGAVNFDYVEITDQVHPGDEVITSDMTKYIQHKEIKIK